MKFIYDGSTVLSKSNQSQNKEGRSLTGLSCGRAGCRHLTLVNTEIQIIGSNGQDYTDGYGNIDIWQNDKTGVNGDVRFYIGSDSSRVSGHNEFLSNYNNNAVFNSYMKNNGGSIEWSTVPSSYYSKTCPDGKSPRGGAPGSNCDGTSCLSALNEYNMHMGKDGNAGGTGGNAGKGATSTVNNSSTDTITSPNTPNMNGGNGANGAAGNLASTDCSLVSASKSYLIKCVRGNGAGGHGHSGGGGGGGMLYHVYSSSSAQTNGIWGWAGSGGAGGCGGNGGQMGHMGVSTFGLLLTPPKYTSEKMELVLDNFNLNLQPGIGGKGQDGQNGLEGGTGGNKIDSELLSSYWQGTGGGKGGKGGNGGGGAGGYSGESFGYTFICNRLIPFSNFDTIEAVATASNMNTLKICGFILEDSFAQDAISSTTVTKLKHGGPANGQKGGEGGKGTLNAFYSNIRATKDTWFK
jgi:hypothetical protein